MNISNYYWYFSGVLTPKFCDDVIAYANAQKKRWPLLVVMEEKKAINH